MIMVRRRASAETPGALQVWETEWVQRMTQSAGYHGDPVAVLQLWLWLQREGWGLIPGARPAPSSEAG